MSQPKRQHFIPKSYLKSFSEEENNKYFIYALDTNNRNENLIKKMSIQDICVSKNLYTLPEIHQGNKYALEIFYADNIDSKFPEILSLLTNDSILEIDIETKIKVVNTLLSLYFRTPKFLNQYYQYIDDVINGFERDDSISTIDMNFLGKKVSINREEANKIAKELKEYSRIAFLQSHLDAFMQLVQIRLNDNIQICKINDESEFITSDNPLIIRPNPEKDIEANEPITYLNRPITPLSKDNVIMIPIDKKTLVNLIPNTFQLKYPSRIQRISFFEQNVTIINSNIVDFSEKWVMGSKNGIENHLALFKKYDEPSQENIEEYEKFVEITLLYKKITEVLQMPSPDKNLLIDLINKLEKNSTAMRDCNIKRQISEIRKKIGYN